MNCSSQLLAPDSEYCSVCPLSLIITSVYTATKLIILVVASLIVGFKVSFFKWMFTLQWCLVMTEKCCFSFNVFAMETLPTTTFPFSIPIDEH